MSKRQFTGEVLVRSSTVVTGGSSEDMRLHSGSLDSATGILTLFLSNAAGEIADPPVSVDMSEIQASGEAGGFTISNDGTVLLANAVPTDLNFEAAQIVATDDGDGTISVTLQSYGTGPLILARRPIVEVTESREVMATDEGVAIHAITEDTLTIGIEIDAVLDLPIGFEFEVLRRGDGEVNILSATGVSINGSMQSTGSIILPFTAVVVRKEAANSWIVTGAFGASQAAPADPLIPEGLPEYNWSDIFTDHTATAAFVPLGDDYDPDNADFGEDWTGWGTTDAEPMDVPLEWFMHNVLPTEAPEGAILNLDPPSGVMFMKGRVQPMPSSLAKNITLDFGTSIVERGYNATEGRWGNLFLWGHKVNDPALGSEAAVDANAAQGDTSIILRDDVDTATLMSVAVYGSIIEIRTDKTGPNYHPTSSRTTAFISSVDPITNTVNLINGLEITVPRDNPVGNSYETSDPSTVTLLQGSLLSANASKGSNVISMASTVGLSVGDWLLVKTEETSELLTNQWSDNTEPNFESDLPDHNASIDAGSHVPINEELHQIAAINGNIVTLAKGLGKNKLVTFSASATKVDPIEGLTVLGGSFRGFETGAPSAWEHQYCWGRYIVNSRLAGSRFDMDMDPTRSALGYRRRGQAIRIDACDNVLIEDHDVGKPQSLGAGEGYGISLRLGARNATIRNCRMNGCRHSIEFWATSGGCIAENNHTSNTTSSCIDTHGNWNVDITIQNNLIDRDATVAAASGDNDGSPDAIRIGNNKFVFDEDIKVLNNRVIGFDGNGLSIVPGVHNVTVDGLEVNGCYRGINFAVNTRNASAYTSGVILRNITIDNWRDRPIYILKDSGDSIFHTVLMENFTLGGVGAADVGNALTDAIDGPFISGIDGLTLRNFTLNGPAREDDGDGRGDLIFTNIDGLVFDNVTMDGTAHGLGLMQDVTGIAGTISILNLTDTNLYETRGNTNRTGTLTINHNQTIGTDAGEVREHPYYQPDSLVLTLNQIP